MPDNQPINTTKFKLDLVPSGHAAAGNWKSVTGGAQICHSTTTSLGSALCKGNKEFDEVEFIGPCVSGGSRAELLQILNDWSTGQYKRIKCTLQLLNTQGLVVRTLKLYDGIPTSYTPPEVRAGDDSLLEERFTIKFERIDG
jgi:hypothetical protein